MSKIREKYTKMMIAAGLGPQWKVYLVCLLILSGIGVTRNWDMYVAHFPLYFLLDLIFARLFMHMVRFWGRVAYVMDSFQTLAHMVKIANKPEETEECKRILAHLKTEADQWTLVPSYTRTMFQMTEKFISDVHNILLEIQRIESK